MRKLGTAVLASVVAAMVGVGGGGGVAHADAPTLMFTGRINYPSASAWGLALSDLDHSGTLDVAVATSGNPDVSVRLGDGAGGLGAAVGYSGGSDPDSVAMGDVNGDGDPDLAVASGLSGVVHVLPGNGVGGFGDPIAVPIGDPFTERGYGVVIADLNGDAHPDLITANAGNDTVSVVLNDGTGNFGSPTEFATGDGPFRVAVGDLNNDAHPDVITSNEFAGTVSVLLGNGAGQFAAKTDFVVGPQPFGIATSDLNGDGRLDVVTTSTAPGSNTLSVLLGTGTGSFAGHVDYATGDDPSSVAVADLNGDGSLDLVTTNYNGGTVSVLLGNGTGTFGAQTEFGPGGGNTRSVAVGDLNGDNRPDLVTANAGSNTVSVLLNVTGVPTSPPLAPTIIRNATASNTSATVSWQAPAWDGGSAIIGYVVTPYVGLASQGPRYFQSTATTQTVPGLTNGTTYRFRVRTWNALGVSGFSKATNAVTPTTTVPGQPTIGTAVAGDGEATVSWTAPASDGGSAIVGYVVTPYVGFASQGPRYFQSTATTQTVPGLTNGTTYRFRVRAVNGIGVSGFSKVTNPVTPTA